MRFHPINLSNYLNHSLLSPFIYSSSKQDIKLITPYKPKHVPTYKNVKNISTGVMIRPLLLLVIHILNWCQHRESIPSIQLSHLASHTFQVLRL